MSSAHEGDDGARAASDDVPGALGQDPYVVRVPPWQSAAVFLIAAVAAILALYSDLNTGARFFAGLIALSAAAAGLVTALAYVVADVDGISLRTLRPRFYPWKDIDSVEVVVRKNQPRLFVFREDRDSVLIPSFLLLPLTPAGMGKTLNRINTAAARIAEQRPV